MTMGDSNSGGKSTKNTKDTMVLGIIIIGVSKIMGNVLAVLDSSAGGILISNGFANTNNNSKAKLDIHSNMSLIIGSVKPGSCTVMNGSNLNDSFVGRVGGACIHDPHVLGIAGAGIGKIAKVHTNNVGNTHVLGNSIVGMTKLNGITELIGRTKVGEHSYPNG